MNKHNTGLVLAPRSSSYLTAFSYVRQAELRLEGIDNKRAEELIASAYASLNQALQTPSRPRRSTLFLAARMAAGLSLRELAHDDDGHEAA